MYSKKSNKTNKKTDFDISEFFQASSIFDDFGTLQNNMDQLKKLDLESLNAADHY